MKTVGQLLHQARVDKKLSLDIVADVTKIRQDYLQAIENDDFSRLPSAAFVKGFIQTFATAVDVPPENALAVFRRDFDQNRQGRIIPRGLIHPIKHPSFVWNPKTTTFAIAIVITSLVIIYAVKQLLSIFDAPTIELIAPKEDIVTTAIVEIKGKTVSDAIVTINNKPVALDLNGQFETNLDLSPGEHIIIIEAKLRDGKTGTLTKTITVKPN